MIGAFTFNEIESSAFNLVCRSVQRPLLPAAKLKRVDIPGASGSYDFPNYEYQLRQVTMQITYLKETFEDMRSQARLIAAWLSTPTYSKLVINDEPDKYYMAKVTQGIDLTALLTAGQASIIFDCQPFAYGVTDLSETFNEVHTNDTCTFTNPGTKEINYRCPDGSSSLMAVCGVWDILIIENGGFSLVWGSVQVTTPHTIIEFDNIAMEAKELTGEDTWTNRFGKLTQGMDTFIPIFPGENVITISGSSVNLDFFTVQYIPLWI